MTKLDVYFSGYNSYHKTSGNKLTHYIGIPLIVYSTLGLLREVHFGNGMDLGLAVWLLSVIFYCRLDWKRAVPFSAMTFALYWYSSLVNWQTHLVLFIVGWILQGIGHYVYEKKSPAFLTNLSHLLIGPFWIFCRAVDAVRSKP